MKAKDLQPKASISTWRSSDGGEIAAGLSAAFEDARALRLGRPQDRPLYEQTILSFGDLKLARFHNSGLCFEATNSANFHLGFAVRGGACVRSRGREVTTGPFAAGNIIRALEQFWVDVSPGTITHTIELPQAVLTRQAEVMFGKVFDKADLGDTVNLRSNAGEALVRNVRAMFTEFLWLEESKLGWLAIASFTELLANLVLVAVFPGVRRELESSVSDSGPVTTRRAREYLNEFAHEPVRIGELAKALGVSVRSLQAGFQRQFGCSPLQFLLARRLAMAHERLTSPLSGDTVTTIAMDCGFMNLGKFASRYRTTYGMLPSQVLKRRGIAWDG